MAIEDKSIQHSSPVVTLEPVPLESIVITVMWDLLKEPTDVSSVEKNSKPEKICTVTERRFIEM